MITRAAYRPPTKIIISTWCALLDKHITIAFSLLTLLFSDKEECQNGIGTLLLDEEVELKLHDYMHRLEGTNKRRNNRISFSHPESMASPLPFSFHHYSPFFVLEALDEDDGKMGKKRGAAGNRNIFSP